MHRAMAIRVIMLAVAIGCNAGLISQAMCNESDGIDGLFAPNPIAEGTAIGVVLEAFGEVTGLRWYNNDSMASIPSIRVYEALSSDEMERGNLLYEAFVVAGADDAWSQLMFNGAVTSETGFICVVLTLPADKPFVAKGKNGGIALGYRASGQGGKGFIMRNDAVMAKLIGCPAVEPILSETSKGGGSQDWFELAERRSRRFFVETWPNPARNGTELHYALPRGEEHELSIYDLRGRLVKRVVSGPAEAGTYTRRWDGRNDRGTPVAAGIYFARLRIGDEIVSHRIAVVK